MSKALKGKRFLVVDDEQVMLNIVGAVLTNFGAESVGVTSPEKVVSLARSESYDFVILDRHMPDGDGNEILKKLKSDATTQNIPVIMLTAETRAQEIKSSIQLGAAGYIVKPFKAKDFYAQLSQIVERNSGQYTIG